MGPHVTLAGPFDLASSSANARPAVINAAQTNIEIDSSLKFT